jgi:hypothetical protein
MAMISFEYAVDGSQPTITWVYVSYVNVELDADAAPADPLDEPDALGGFWTEPQAARVTVVAMTAASAASRVMRGIVVPLYGRVDMGLFKPS